MRRRCYSARPADWVRFHPSRGPVSSPQSNQYKIFPDSGGLTMNKRSMLRLALAAPLLALAAGTNVALAQDAFKIGLILPMTGPFASTGRQIDAAVKLWMAQNGTT